MKRFCHEAPAALLAALVLVGGERLAAQSSQTRSVTSIVARSRDSLGANLMARPLSDGSVILNDVSKRRLVLFDSTLTKVTVIADSAAGSQSYGNRPAGLIAYAGDSTLFVDPASSSLLVVAPSGKVARVMSAPRAQDVTFLTSIAGGQPRIDPSGRLVYRGIARNTNPFTFSPNGTFIPPTPPDSAPILRVNLSTRKLDTATWIKIPKERLSAMASPTGGTMISTMLDPLPIGDDWALLSDGSIAVLKGRDYHVEVISPQGTRSTGLKIPFDWQRVTDDDRSALIDSIRADAEATRAAARPPGGAAPVLPPILVVSPNELPDYRPPFRAGNARGDAEGRLWVQTTAPKPPNGGLLVDVITAKGELADRFELPIGRRLLAVGPNRTLFLVAHDSTGNFLERARLP